MTPVGDVCDTKGTNAIHLYDMKYVLQHDIKQKT